MDSRSRLLFQGFSYAIDSWIENKIRNPTAVIWHRIKLKLLGNFSYTNTRSKNKIQNIKNNKSCKYEAK